MSQFSQLSNRRIRGQAYWNGSGKHQRPSVGACTAVFLYRQGAQMSRLQAMHSPKTHENGVINDLFWGRYATRVSLGNATFFAWLQVHWFRWLQEHGVFGWPSHWSTTIFSAHFWGLPIIRNQTLLIHQLSKEWRRSAVHPLQACFLYSQDLPVKSFCDAATIMMSQTEL